MPGAMDAGAGEAGVTLGFVGEHFKFLSMLDEWIIYLLLDVLYFNDSSYFINVIVLYFILITCSYFCILGKNPTWVSHTVLYNYT